MCVAGAVQRDGFYLVVSAHLRSTVDAQGSAVLPLGATSWRACGAAAGEEHVWCGIGRDGTVASVCL